MEAADAELIAIEISRKDKPLTTVGSLLIVNTNLTSSNKIPCLFAGTNVGAIFAFEITFEDDTEDNVSVKLSKELHLQHKAPILLMLITNANHVPLVGSVDQIGTFQRLFIFVLFAECHCLLFVLVTRFCCFCDILTNDARIDG